MNNFHSHEITHLTNWFWYVLCGTIEMRRSNLWPRQRKSSQALNGNVLRNCAISIQNLVNPAVMWVECDQLSCNWSKHHWPTTPKQFNFISTSYRSWPRSVNDLLLFFFCLTVLLCNSQKKKKIEKKNVNSHSFDITSFQMQKKEAKLSIHKKILSVRFSTVAMEYLMIQSDCKH